MEKNKNRTDLLAAGRKKLQQFRQKKETKGKSSHKYSKSEHEGDADLAPPAITPLASPKAAEGEPASPLNADIGLIHSSALLSKGKSVVLDTDLSTTDRSVLHKTAPSTNVVLAHVDLEEKESLAADTEQGVHSSVPLFTMDAGGENALNVGADKTQFNLMGISDITVVDRAQPRHAAELEPADSLASHATVVGVTRDEEKESFPLQEYFSDMLLIQERENQEADCLGSNQCHGSGEENRLYLQDGESLKGGLTRLELERDEGFLASKHREHGENLAEASYNGEDIEDATHRTEGTNDMDGVSMCAEANPRVEGTHVVGSDSVYTVAIHKTEGNADLNPEEASVDVTEKVKGTNEGDDASVFSDENHKTEGPHEVDGFSLSTEAAHKAEGTLDTNPDESTEEATNRTEGSNEVDGVSVYAEADHKIEGTHDKDDASVFSDENHKTGPHEVGGFSVSTEATHKAEGTLDTNPDESTEEATNRTEGSNEVDGVSVYAEADHKIEGSHDEDNVSVSNVATHMAEGTVDMNPQKGTENATQKAEGTNEMAGTLVFADEIHKVEGPHEVGDVFVSTEAALMEVGTLGTIPDEPTNEATNRTEGSNEVDSDPCFAEANNSFEGTHKVGSISFSAEATHEAEETPYMNSEGKPDPQLENVKADSSCEGNLGIMSLPLDSETEWKQGLQADMVRDRTVDEVNKQQCLSDGAVLVVSKSQEKLLEAERVVFSGGRTVSRGAEKGSVDLYQLAEVLKELDEAEVRFLLKSIPSASKVESGNMGDFTVQENGFADVLESLKQHLYSTNVAKDFLHLQLAEQIEFQMEFEQQAHQFQNEVSMLCFSLKETQEYNKSLNKELAQCRSELWDLAAGRKELESQSLSAREEIEESTTKACELQTKLEISHEELTVLSVELADCKGLLEALETENAKLSGDLILVTEERKKLEVEKDYLVHENEKFSALLVEHQEHMAMEHVKHAQLEVDLNEAIVSIERLTEENMVLSSSLDIHKAKLKQIENENFQSLPQSGDIRNQLDGSDMPSTMHNYSTDDEYSHRNPERCDGKVASGVVGEHMPLSLKEGSLQQLERGSFDDSVRSGLKTNLEEAEKIIQKLEKEIEGMHAHSVLFNRSGGKAAASGVSKLIQAFEGKVHHDDNDSEEIPLTEGEQTVEDPYKLAKEQMSILRTLLKQLDLNAEKVNELFREEQDSRKLATVAINELEILYEASEKQTRDLEAKNIELVKKLSKYQSRIDDLDRNFCKIQQNSDEMGTLFLNQVENLHREVGEKTFTLEQEWSSAIAAMSFTVEKLDASMGKLHTSSSSTVPSDALSIGCHFTNSINAASKVIDDLCRELESSSTGHKAILCSYRSLTEKFSELHVKNELAVGILGMIYSDLRQFICGSCEDVVWSEMNANDGLVDVLQTGNYVNLIRQLGKLLGERMLLKSAKNELESELINKTQEIEELSRRCIDLKPIFKLVEDVKTIFKVDDIEIDPDKPPALFLESLVALLIQKYRGTIEQISLSKEEFGSKVMELGELQGKMDQLSSLNLQQEDEICILKESLRKVELALEAVRSELQVKAVELEQSEQRVLSVREKLSIAVAKGKGLIVQRDGLKQSLSEMSTELERCSQELHLKDTRLREVETKLKDYSEAGERIEALESELSYIRNSATALRESFLLKDSVLQRIEEILEDLELPEQFHSRDINEKIEWLARSAVGNSLPMTDWDQRSSVGGGSYSDSGFVVMDGWKDYVQPSSNPGLDDLRRKYEDVQSKFYGLAEQNEMLEQSLMERNSLVQRWEEVLDRIDMPLQLRSIEPEDRIKWLGSALSEAHHDRDSLHRKIENFETYCGSMAGDLEESQKKTSDLEAALLGITLERELLSESLQNLTRENEKIAEKAVQYELEKDNLQHEVTSLQEKLAENNNYHNHIKGEMKRFQVMVCDALQDQSTEDGVCDDCNTEHLEGLLRELIEKYRILSFEKPSLKYTEVSDVVLDEQRKDDALKDMEQDPVILKEDLEQALNNLVYVKGERDKILEKHQSLVVEFEALGKQRDDLQEQLNQEEQKLASAREKLNVAVRKGKGLVQQRDSLKQTIEETNTEVERLKTDLNKRENALVQYELKIKDLSTYPEKVEALERERMFLRNRLEETEHNLSDSGHTLSRLLNTLNAIDFGSEMNFIDPVHKMEGVGKLCLDLQAAITSSEHESKKSKRANELLLAELNEVQERADGLQEELANVEAALAELSKERDAVEASKIEAFSCLEKSSNARSEERKRELAEILKLKAGIDQLRKGSSAFTNLLADVLSMDLELLRNTEAWMESLLKQMDGSNVVDLPLGNAPVGMFSSNSVNEVKFPTSGTLLETMMHDHFNESSMMEVFDIVGHGMQECRREIDALRENLYKHSISSDQQAKRLSKVMEAVCKEITSQKESLESTKRDITHLELMKKVKDTETLVLHRNIALLYKACTRSIVEIENQKAQMVGNGLASGVHLLEKAGMDLKLTTGIDGPESVNGQSSFTEAWIRNVADNLLLAVKDLASIQTEIMEGNQKELKATILNLQKELQEKDIQRNRICAELVSQIKEAEATSKKYSVDLEAAKTHVDDLEKRIEAVEEERNMLKLRIRELQDGEASSVELQKRILSLTDLLTAKEQEIEALMQALDEEESQMEGLTNRIEELERVLQQKNVALETLEASREKAMAKLSTTVNKFDELHQLSESLLSEIENLQSQLQGRDVEISFLRQEVTRCTNDVLAASQESNKRNSTGMHDLLTWLDMLVSRFGGHDVHFDDRESSRMQAYKEILEKQITSVMTELEDLRVMSQRKDALLQVERSRIEELLHKEETLENSLREKEFQLASFHGARDAGEATSLTSAEIMEVEPMINKRAVAGASITPHVRSVRKVNNDQVAIGIDMDPGPSTVDEDDDKVHGFKSLTTSRIVPRFTRPISDKIDGLWVSCDRALMRQPALRLGIIIYWIVVHALLATSIV